MPAWVQQIAAFLPFQWTFGFPIEALVGSLPPEQLLGGLVMQAVWIGIGAVVLNRAFAFAVKRYSAVGG
jgi:ABC-2 type transport system permease protein